VSVWPAAESLAWICSDAAVPAVEVWLPGSATWTILPPEPGATVSAKSSTTNDVSPLPVSTPVSFSVTVCPAYGAKLNDRWM